MIDRSQDAFGVALLDYLDGKDVPDLVLQVQGGQAVPAMDPEWFFRDFQDWEWQDRELLPPPARGPVLDLGTGLASLDHIRRLRLPNRRGGGPARSPTWSYPAQPSDR